MEKKTAFCYLVFLIMLEACIPMVSSSCTCDAVNDEVEIGQKREATKLKIYAFASILVFGAIGVSLPNLGSKIMGLQPGTSSFFIVKAFATGVIVATAFIHVLPDSYIDLANPCLNESPWRLFPWTGFCAMVAALCMHMIDSFAISYYENLYSKGGEKDEERRGSSSSGAQVHSHSSHHYSHSTGELQDLETTKHKVVSQVLELGIIVHSVIIGISMGASQSSGTIKPLIIAISFHQFFEGMGLGGCISQAKFSKGSLVTLVLFFSLTTPIGIGIGMAISNDYNENSPKSLIVEGILNAVSAGILIYMSLVDLLAADFANPVMRKNVKLQSCANVSLLIGACCMSVLAKWA